MMATRMASVATVIKMATTDSDTNSYREFESE